MKVGQLGKIINNLVKAASFCLPADVEKLLLKAFRQEKSGLSKKALNWVIKNAHIAKTNSLAICQDTGLPVVFLELGKGSQVSAEFIDAVKKNVARAYRVNFLRASGVDPLIRNKPGYTGVIVHIETSNKSPGIKITILPKGFGSENKSRVKMFNPTAGWKDIENFIVEAVRAAGPEACPPFFVGVGIGGTSDTAMLLAKKALLDRLDKPNRDVKLAKKEAALLKKLNRLNIGIMGFGGKNTALAVRIKTAPTHIAGLPVAVNISCHALRKATVIMK